MSGYAHPEALVETDWLAEHATDPSVRVFEVDVDTNTYDQGHVAGAIGLNWKTDLQQRPVRDLLSKTLALAEYDVDMAPDGRTALERLRIMPYDLLITDLKMPGVDGLTVIREARRLKADLPVIIITGFSNEASAIEAVNLGVAGYLTKPFRVPQVLAAAAKALGE